MGKEKKYILSFLNIYTSLNLAIFCKMYFSKKVFFGLKNIPNISSIGSIYVLDCVYLVYNLITNFKLWFMKCWNRFFDAKTSARVTSFKTLNFTTVYMSTIHLFIVCLHYWLHTILYSKLRFKISPLVFRSICF